MGIFVNVNLRFCSNYYRLIKEKRIYFGFLLAYSQEQSEG